MREQADITGNDYVSISSIGPDCALDGITVLHGAMSGLIEWTGDGGVPLLRPVVHVDGEQVDLGSATWRRLDRWLPTFSLRLEDGSELTGVVCAPAGYPAARGFLVRIGFENRGRVPRSVQVALEIRWSWSSHWIRSARPLAGDNCMAVDPTGVMTLETDGGRGVSLAIVADNSTPPGPAHAANGTLLEGRMTVAFDVASKAHGSAAFYIGAGRERDGAIAAAAQLRRAGAERWLRQTRLELSHILRAAQSNRWSETLNRNLIFNRYFAVGRGIDDDRLHLLRSRSTRCEQPALFNEREALLWTMPALILADPGLAREAVMRLLETYSERSGEHTRYLDGGAFDAGFVLDQFLLYPWLIDTYITSTGDTTFHDEPLVRQIVLESDSGAFMRLHPEHVLASTDLLPSGELADYPFATMANALLHAFCVALERLPWPEHPESEPRGQEASNVPADGRPLPSATESAPRLAGAASEVSAALWRHCMTNVDGQAVLASSTDLAGSAAVYDDPALSFALLPLFGICSTDDPVWRDTMEFLRSSSYPLWRDGAVAGLAGRSDVAHAQFAALCADLHGHAPEDALERLLKVGLPAGVAAAAYDPADGSVIGPHHAALAGFLAWTLVRVTERAARPEARKKRRR